MKKKYGSRLGGLANWAAGGIGHSKSPEQTAAENAANTIKEHRENVLFLLRLRLQQAGQLQASMMETRIMRELEKNKSVLYKSTGRMGHEIGGPDVPPFEYHGGEAAKQEQHGELSRNFEDELSPEQLQMFEKENQDMVKHYEDTLNQVKYVTLPPRSEGCANGNIGRLRNRWSRSRNFKHNLSRIWQLSRRILICWLQTLTSQQRMLVVVTRSSRRHQNGRAQPNMSSTRHVQAVSSSSDGI